MSPSRDELGGGTVGLPRFPVPEPGKSVVSGTREPGIWSGSKTVPGQAFFRQKLCIKSCKLMVVLPFGK